MIKKSYLKSCPTSHPARSAWLALVVSTLFFALCAFPQAAAAEENDAVTGLIHGFFAGGTLPLGTLNTHQDANVHLRGYLGYIFSERISLLGYIGFSQFTEDEAPLDLNYYWFNVSVNLKVNLITTPKGVSYYVQAGPGIYLPKAAMPGVSTSIGANVGIGSQIPIGRYFKVLWAFDLHCTNFGTPRYWFTTMQLGILYIW